MPEKIHWPFGGDPWMRGGRGSMRLTGSGGKGGSAVQSQPRQYGRHDRLIVGGRAHTKKSGLS